MMLLNFEEERKITKNWRRITNFVSPEGIFSTEIASVMVYLHCNSLIILLQRNAKLLRIFWEGSGAATPIFREMRGFCGGCGEKQDC